MSPQAILARVAQFEIAGMMAEQANTLSCEDSAEEMASDWLE
jgi:hypothetical protein